MLFIIDTCHAESMSSLFYSPNIIGVGSSLVTEESFSVRERERKKDTEEKWWPIFNVDYSFVLVDQKSNFKSLSQKATILIIPSFLLLCPFYLSSIISMTLLVCISLIGGRISLSSS